MIGTTVGKYRILDRLGRGGMGIVYRALDETLDREVAIKVLNPDLSDNELMKRFRAEAVSLARLNHPGIATIYELHRNGDDLLMVMEFVRGQTLQTLSEQLGPFDPPRAAHICIQILDALAHAHRAGIVHRDLKPANVMMTEAGLVKIMDFGIARMLGGESLTHAGLMMGTPAYMAPEQVLGQEIDGRADLYSVGVLFYRLLSRELPFQADNAIAMAQKQVADQPTPIGTFRPNLPPWCEAIIVKALSKAPADRFQSAEAFRAAIRSSVTPESFGDLPTLATATPASLFRPSDLTLPSGPSEAPTMTRLVHDSGVRPSTSTSATSPSAAIASGTAATPAVERTGTTVVLSRGHMISLSAVLLILIVGIAALGYAAFKNSPEAAPTASSQPSEPNPQPTGEGTPGAPPPDTQASTSVPAPLPPPAAARVSPPAPPTRAAGGATPGVPGGVDPALQKAKSDGKVTRDAAPEVPAASTEPSESTAKTVAPITLKNVKVLVAQGNTMREREVVLTLAGDHLAAVNPSDANQILSIPYASIVQPFYSRSKHPKWTGPDGKEVSASVDLGKMSFFRGERNWLILTTQADPVFIRFEDAQLRTALAAVEERLGRRIQR